MPSPYVPAGQRRAAEILAFPALKSIPPPQLPLQGEAWEHYRSLADKLLDARKLNDHTRAICEQAAVMFGKIHQRVSKGLNVSGAEMERYNKALKELRLVDQSDASAPPEPKGENRYARVGAILRRGAEEATL